MARRGRTTPRRSSICAGATTNPPGLGYADGTGAGARFNGASGVAIAGGDAFVVDNSNSCIRRVAGVFGSCRSDGIESRAKNLLWYGICRHR